MAEQGLNGHCGWHEACEGFRARLWPSGVELLVTVADERRAGEVPALRPKWCSLPLMVPEPAAAPRSQEWPAGNTSAKAAVAASSTAPSA